MRWQTLFDDLEAQVASLATAERAAEVRELARGEVGRLSVGDRLRASLGAAVRVRLCGGSSVAGGLVRVGPEWMLLDEPSGHELVIALRQVRAIRGLARYSAVPDSVGVVESRLGLRHVLRGIARDRSAVRIMLDDGSALDATIDRVGADFVEAAVHPAAEPRRRPDVRDHELLPVDGVAAVRRLP